MTGNDHTNALNGDVITGALRSPALPFERDHEAAVLADMVEALWTAPEPSSLRRHRRVVAFAAVTVASLGVGGIIAAGPGGFRPFINDDKSPATTVFGDSVPAPAPDDLDDEDDDDDDDDGGGGGGTERITTDPDFECADSDNANHGQTVSSAAQAPGSNRAAAQSECGKPLGSGNGNGETGNSGNERITADPDFDCVDGDNANHGQTVSSAAKAPGPNNAAAQSECGKPVGSGTGETDDNVEDETNNGNGNGNYGVPGPPASTPDNGNGNGHANTTTTQPAG